VNIDATDVLNLTERVFIEILRKLKTGEKQIVFKRQNEPRLAVMRTDIEDELTTYVKARKIAKPKPKNLTIMNEENIVDATDAAEDDDENSDEEIFFEDEDDEESQQPSETSKLNADGSTKEYLLNKTRKSYISKKQIWDIKSIINHDYAYIEKESKLVSEQKPNDEQTDVIFDDVDNDEISFLNYELTITLKNIELVFSDDDIKVDDLLMPKSVIISQKSNPIPVNKKNQSFIYQIVPVLTHPMYMKTKKFVESDRYKEKYGTRYFGIFGPEFVQ
jgi:hypothetical protein